MNLNLNQADVELFYGLFFRLIDYTNEKYKVVPGLKKTAGAKEVDPAEMKPVRDKLWESDDLIHSIVADNPLKLAERELSIVASWSKRVVGDFLIYKHLKRYTVFMGQGGLYGVTGIVSPIPEMFPSFLLPRSSEAVLLPFEGKIIHDSLIYNYNVTYGSGAKKRFKEEYRELKEKNGIITSL